MSLRVCLCVCVCVCVGGIVCLFLHKYSVSFYLQALDITFYHTLFFPVIVSACDSSFLLFNTLKTSLDFAVYSLSFVNYENRNTQIYFPRNKDQNPGRCKKIIIRCRILGN